MPATSRAMTQMLSPIPKTKTRTRIEPNQGINAAASAARQTSDGPARNADRVPKRSRTAPLMGIPAKRPKAKAVTVCAAVPGDTSKNTASTGIAGTIIDHIPASRVLV